MNTEQYLLACLAEECGEVIQRIGKALRFGMDEIQPEQTLTNRERLQEELNDVLYIMGILGFVPETTPEYKQTKTNKFRIIFKRSIEKGVLTIEELEDYINKTIS